MITIRFKQVFRERVAECLTSLAMIVWGFLILGMPHEATNELYLTVLTNIMSRDTWGIVAIMAGFLRLACLGVNGYWRPSAHLRAVGAIVGSMLWGSLAISYCVSVIYPPTALAAVIAMLAFDNFAIWYSAGDAKVADTQAKQVA